MEHPNALRFSDAVDADAAAIADLVNRAYRAVTGKAGWTNEQALIDGPRTSEAGVRALLKRGRIVLARAAGRGAMVGCIHVAVDGDGAWHTAMLAVDPHSQIAGAGKAIKAAIEAQARASGATRMRMEVIRQRETLIAWHRRRGYVPTGAILPFPYDDPSVGIPRQPGLELVVMEKDISAR